MLFVAVTLAVLSSSIMPSDRNTPPAITAPIDVCQGPHCCINRMVPTVAMADPASANKFLVTNDRRTRIEPNNKNSTAIAINIGAPRKSRMKGVASMAAHIQGKYFSSRLVINVSMWNLIYYATNLEEVELVVAEPLASPLNSAPSASVKWRH